MHPDISSPPAASPADDIMTLPAQMRGEMRGAFKGGVRLRPSARWKPGVAAGAIHSEIFTSGHEAAGAALAIALAQDAAAAGKSSSPDASSPNFGALDEIMDQRSVLWVQDRASVRLTGRPYRHGLPQHLRHRIIHVVAEKAEDVLFALEEGLRCRDLAFVIGELAGNPRRLNFTASRRLSLAAERHGVPLWLVRVDAAHDLSSARMRWDVRSAPSATPRWNGAAPGIPCWHGELFRSRSHVPGHWILRDDPAALSAYSPAAPPTDITDDNISHDNTANENDVSFHQPRQTGSVDLARATVGRSMAAL